MNTAGASELGYASRAIVGALLEELISTKLLSAGAATNVLDQAVISLKGLGNLVSVPGAVAIVGDIRAELAKHGVK
jgi:hypothetical protein